MGSRVGESNLFWKVMGTISNKGKGQYNFNKYM